MPPPPPQLQDAESSHRPGGARLRANTTSFALWRRGPPTSPPTTQTAQPLAIDALIEGLAPPSVPSLNYARSLVAALSTPQSSIPNSASLNPVLASLCSSESPVALQVAGYEILAAYLEHAPSLPTTSDKLAFFSLLSGSSPAWSQDLWEPRFRALRALMQTSLAIVGVESEMIKLILSWVKSAFDGLLVGPNEQNPDRVERERAVDTLSTFLASVTGQVEQVARLPEGELTAIFVCYAELVDRSLAATDFVPSSTPTSPGQESNCSTPTRSMHTHRRHPSSTSISLLSPSTPSVVVCTKPSDLAIRIYLDHLSSQMKLLPPTTLDAILPLLFRCLGYYSSTLPRMSLTPSPPPFSLVEKRLTEVVYSLFTGSFATTCSTVMRRYIFPRNDWDYDSPSLFYEVKGSFRTLRIIVRRALANRLARSLISRETTFTYLPSGAPGQIDLGRDLMERAWAKEDLSAWEPAKIGRVLHRSLKAWAGFNDHEGVKIAVLDEVAAITQDMLQSFDLRGEDDEMDDDEASAIGETIFQLAAQIPLLQRQDGPPFILPLVHPNNAPSSFLRRLSSILGRSCADTPVEPPISFALLSIAEHIADADMAKVLDTLLQQHHLSPTSPSWLKNWEKVLAHPSLCAADRPLARQAVMHCVQITYSAVKELKSYRKPFADLLREFWKRKNVDESDGNDGTMMWRILGDEVVLRTVEATSIGTLGKGGDSEEVAHTTDVVNSIIELMATIAVSNTRNDVLSSVIDHPQHRPFSPPLTRMQSDFENQTKGKESSIPSVISMLSSFAPATSSRAQSQPSDSEENEPPTDQQSPSSPSLTQTPRTVGAVVGLITIFTQMAFTPFSLSQANLDLAIRVYHTLLQILDTAICSRARLTVLQFLLRLRSDRDHRIYFADASYDRDGHTANLAVLASRGFDRSSPGVGTAENETATHDESMGDSRDIRKARSRVPQERDGRRASRGRGLPTSKSASSRSRSRVPAPNRAPPNSTSGVKSREELWHLPDTLPFSVAEVETASEGLISYDPDLLGGRIVLPISKHLRALLAIIENEKDWEILSYVLCHLPVQLANKHLFCGPKSRETMVVLLTTLCTGILKGDLGCKIDRWPSGMKTRDAQGLAYHTLSVLISYRRCFDTQLQHVLVEVLLAGLNDQPSTIKCCLHSLSLAAFEMQNSMTKYMSRILEKLSQIISNPAMAVHILDFLVMVASLPGLYANFTESDFKMVFGVALRYLQHHNRPGSSLGISWTLSEHVRIMCFYLVYVWFLAIKLPDRPRHVPFITRQLLLANEGKEKVDEPTEVCFDWLARYAYGSADPRPAGSLLNDIVTESQGLLPAAEAAISEKTWIQGNSVVTIRVLPRRGWIEVICRRPSGFTKFLCRAENVPIVGPGDVDPDFITSTAALLLDHDALESGSEDQPTVVSGVTSASGDCLDARAQGRTQGFLVESGGDTAPRPDPITGYVWSGSAPSQRRKEVAVDPSFFALQLSAYPDGPARSLFVADSTSLPPFFRTLDRMPVIDTHKVGIMYVSPGQTSEEEILRNTHGSPAYARFLEGLGRLIDLRGQMDVYAGGLDPDEDGEYAYAWWDDIGQILYHTATLMPTNPDDMYCINKKRHIGNDYVRIVWNDSGHDYQFDTLRTQFQFVNIVIEPHSHGAIAAYSNNLHEIEYFKVKVQRAPGMEEFTPIGDFKLVSADNLPFFVRQLSSLSDWFASVFDHERRNPGEPEMMTNWRSRLREIQRFRGTLASSPGSEEGEGLMRQEGFRDFTTSY